MSEKVLMTLLTQKIIKFLPLGDLLSAWLGERKES